MLSAATLSPPLRVRLFLLLLVSMVFGACRTVSFVAPYDAVTDAAIQNAAQKMEAIFSDAAATGAGHAKYKDDYREAHGALAAVAMRAEIYDEAKNRGEITAARNLQQTLRNLERLHRGAGSLRNTDVATARLQMRLLMQHELAKKRSAAITAPKEQP
jgi:hypothetical protein